MTLAPPAVAVNVPDADLLAAVARGDRAALDALARRYIDFVYAAARRQAPADAADVTQAVFLVLAEKAGSVRAPSLAAWLHQTTRYAAANANRAARRRRQHEQAAARPEAMMPTSTAEPDPLLPLLDDAIAALGETDRRAVVGRYLLGQNATAVAATLGTTPKAAQKRIDRAVERLRGTLLTAMRRSTSPASAGLPAAAVATVLAAAAPTPAPAAVALATPTAGAASLAKGSASARTWAHAKAAALIAAAGIAVGGAAVAVRRLAAAPVPPPLATNVAAVPPPASAPAAFAPAAPVTRATVAGVTIDFIGLAAFPSRGQPWYDPAGRTLAVRPYDEASVMFGTQADRVVREFAFAIDSAKLGVAPWKVQPDVASLRLNAERSSSGSGNAVLSPAYSEGPSAKPGRLLSAVASIRADQPATLWFDIAAGPWVSRIVGPRDGDDVIRIAEGDVRRVRLTRSFADEQGVASVGYCTAEFYSDPDVQLAAIDTDGRAHLSAVKSWNYRPPYERAAEPVMDVQLPAMNLANVPLGRVIDRLKNEAGLTISVDWVGLKAAGVDESTRVSARLTRLPLYEWLSRLFQSIRAARLEFDVTESVVLIRGEDPRRPRRSWFSFPGLPWTKLDHVEVQTRAFDRWAAFEGINPELGKQSQVVIRTNDTAPPPTPTRPPAGR